ncbi:hypothetical protein ACQKWADRAFT_136135 [Trichoderma austrokoningii]
MEFTPESGKSGGVVARKGEVVKTLSGLKAWLSVDLKTPATPKTPTPMTPILKNEVVQESLIVMTENPSPDEAAKNGEVAKTFSSLKSWLSNDLKTPATPTTPTFWPPPRNTSSMLKNKVVQESLVVTTENPSSDETKEFSEASAHTTEDPTHPSAYGVSDTSQQEQNGANYCFKRPPSILDTINRILSPEKPTGQEEPLERRATPIERESLKRRATPKGQERVKRRATPINSPALSQGTDFKEAPLQPKKTPWAISEGLSWNISEGLSDNGFQDDQAHYISPEEAHASQTREWLSQTANRFAEVDLLAYTTMDHYKNDINPETGELLLEVPYPDTYRALDSGPSRDHRDIAWRQDNLTSELQINREIRSRETLATKLRLQMECNEPEAKPVAIEPPAWPDAECIVRPAKPKDFGAIAAIMNLESKAKINPQVLEWKEVVAADIQQIYQSCRDNLRPFVVATTAEDPLLDRSNWPPNATKAHQSYLTFRSSQAEVPEEVLGFAFVTEARVGILGTTCPGSRHAGQIKVIVHPDHRGKLYGSALLDRVLLCIAPFHRSSVDYKWQCQDSAKIYEKIAYQNHRTYAWIYIETFCADRADPAMQPVTRFLQKFEFREVGCLPSAIKTDRHYESQWLDLVLWAREAQPRSNIMDSAPGAQPEADRIHMYQTPIRRKKNYM